MGDNIYSLTNVSDADMPDAVAKVGLYVKETTGMGLDFTPDELDDLTTRKVVEVPFSGDALARIIRARRGVARATGQRNPYPAAVQNFNAEANLWGSVADAPVDGDRRMAAVGRVVPEWGRIDGQPYVLDIN